MSWPTCPTCGGGTYQTIDRRTICPTCQMLDSKCAACEGKGRIERRGVWRKEPCATCGGTGYRSPSAAPTAGTGTETRPADSSSPAPDGTSYFAPGVSYADVAVAATGRGRELLFVRTDGGD